MEKPAKQKTLKILQIIGSVLMYIFFALCMFVLILSIFSKKDADGTAKVFGYEMRIVITGSMEKHKDTWDNIKQYKIKNIPQNSAVFIELVPEDEQKADEWYAELKKGDVLTFQYYTSGKPDVVTHRIFSITSEEGGYYIVLEGDNLSDNGTVGQQEIHTGEEGFTYVIGKVVATSHVLGVAVTELKKPVVIALVIIVPCALIIIFEIIRIVNLLNGEKRRKVEEKAQEQLSEMEELKRRLAELEGNKQATPSADAPTSNTNDSQAITSENAPAINADSANNTENAEINQEQEDSK